MIRTPVMYVYFVISGSREQIMTGVDDNGKMIPLVYLNREDLQLEKMRPFVEKYAEATSTYVELREYTLVEQTVEKIYPQKGNYNA